MSGFGEMLLKHLFGGSGTGDIDWNATRRQRGLPKPQTNAQQLSSIFHNYGIRRGNVQPGQPRMFRNKNLPSGVIARSGIRKKVKTFTTPGGKTIRRTVFRQKRRGSITSTTGSVIDSLRHQLSSESLLG
jgi:hypothetical protein